MSQPKVIGMQPKQGTQHAKRGQCLLPVPPVPLPPCVELTVTLLCFGFAVVPIILTPARAGPLGP